MTWASSRFTAIVTTTTGMILSVLPIHLGPPAKTQFVGFTVLRRNHCLLSDQKGPQHMPRKKFKHEIKTAHIPRKQAWNQWNPKKLKVWKMSDFPVGLILFDHSFWVEGCHFIRFHPTPGDLQSCARPAFRFPRHTGHYLEGGMGGVRSAWMGRAFTKLAIHLMWRKCDDQGRDPT